MSKFVHMELSTSDPEAAAKFYKGVFGWKYQKMKMSDGSVYTGIQTAEGEGIGGISHVQGDAPPHWLGYVGVDSVKRTTAKIEKRGGKVMLPMMDIDGMGWIAIYSDPQGAVFGVWQPNMAAPQPGAEQAAPAKKASKKKAAAKKATKAAAPKKASKKAAPKKASKKAAKKASKKK